VFSFPLKYGSKNALNNLKSIVITQKAAEDLFGTDNVVGRTIEIKIDEDFVPFTVTGVAENIPANSSIRFQSLGNFSYFETTGSGTRGVNNWNRSSYITYVQLNPGSGLPGDMKRLASFRHKYYPDEEQELKKSGFSWTGTEPPVR